jgi:hypothetical protein
MPEDTSEIYARHVYWIPLIRVTHSRVGSLEVSSGDTSLALLSCSLQSGSAHYSSRQISPSPFCRRQHMATKPSGGQV